MHRVVPAVALGHWHKQHRITAQPSREGSLLVSLALCYTGTELGLGEIPKEILISPKNPLSSWKHLLLFPEEQLLWLKVERGLSWYSKCWLVLINRMHLGIFSAVEVGWPGTASAHAIRLLQQGDGMQPAYSQWSWLLTMLGASGEKSAGTN